MEPLSLKVCFQQAIVPMCIRFPIAILVIAYLMVVIKTERYWDVQFLQATAINVFSDVRIFKLWLLVFAGVVAYPYFRTRNPNYIKKMEEYERKKNSSQGEISEDKQSL